MDRKIRILLSKVGLDAHDRGIHVLEDALRDAGMEVIVNTFGQKPEDIVKIAIEKNVDVIGISIHSATHNVYLPEIVKLLKKENADIPVIVGGVIPDEDAARLKKTGVKEIFKPGESLDIIIEFIKKLKK
ncbi:MAG TPA: cobalamin-dependent protein [archaeon]|nr:cobalamin-dependent protein [archaeon]